MKLDELVPGMKLTGLTGGTVEVVSAEWLSGDFVRIVYRDESGGLGEQLIDDTQAASIAPDRPHRLTDAASVRRWKAGAEALRIKHAALIDPMLAVSSSTLQPLPHQIKAVYGEFLPRTPLRYLLADDPGAGKTIMCGLYIKELRLRGDLERCLIVAPGGLVDQWQEELWEKFGLNFTLMTRELVNTVVGASVFEDHPLLIARMDMLARNEELMNQLDHSSWDLVVVDEAHRMSATYAGRDLVATQRYNLGRRLGKVARNFLLMTATPHSGDPSRFQAFLALLDEDRRTGHAGTAPGTDLMRRMLKEELLTMEGKHLFPERMANTVTYQLTAGEAHLYNEVSEYVRFEMNRAQRLGDGHGNRANTVGFALTVLQRRLASSPEAILRSLERRRTRLSKLRQETERLATSEVVSATELDAYDREVRETGPDLFSEEHEETLVDAASAARTVAELAVEIATLDRLVALARTVRLSETDCKWLQLRSILEDNELTRDPDGRPRKLIVFTEHRDTLRYLTERIEALPGRSAGVVEIHGGLNRHARREVQRRFTHDPATAVLVATDAAGEGLNLQCAHLMVNYDLPWNPNRIEQRFGRIHRIGQTEVCHLWNLVAEDTREGDVFRRLLSKMEEQAKAYQGKVFDVVGEAFQDRPLRDLLIQAIAHGDDPEVREQLNRVIDETVANGIPELVERRALYAEVLEQIDVEAARQRMEDGTRSRIQPHFLSSWFDECFRDYGGRARRRSDGSYDVSHVPELIKSTARENGLTVRTRYEAATFEPRAAESPTGVRPEIFGPGHPMLDALAETVHNRAEEVLARGVVLVDDSADSSEVRLFAVVKHEIADGGRAPNTLSRRIAFVELLPGGEWRDAGAAYLDYRPLAGPETEIAERLLSSSGREPELEAREWAMQKLVPEHLTTTRSANARLVDRMRSEVDTRLATEVEHWRSKARGADEDAGHASKRVGDLEERRMQRLSDLESRSRVIPRPPIVLATAWVIPSVVLVERPHGRRKPVSGMVDLVKKVERELGHDFVRVEDEAARVPYVVTRDAAGQTRWIALLAEDPSGTASVGRVHVLESRNLGTRYRLALISGEEVRYAANPFARPRLDSLDDHEHVVSWRSVWRNGLAPW